MSSERGSDADQYLRILSDTTANNHALLRECGAIEASELRGDCALAIARRGAISGGAAEWCPLVEPGIWSDECWFAASESTAMRGEIAAAAQQCLEAGQFQEQCRLHVFQLQLPGEIQPGFSSDAAAAEQHYAALLKTWEIQRAAPALQRMWRDWFALVGIPVGGCEVVTQVRRGACEAGAAKTRPDQPAR